MGSGRSQLLIIIAVAMVSLGGSYLLFYFSQNSDGWGTTNHGAFVQPPLTIDQLGWQSAEGAPLAPQHWWIWLNAKTCETECRQAVKDMRALHILLNREADRVRRGLTIPAQIQAPDWLTQYPELVRIESQTPPSNGEGIYLVDPLGYVVLFYAMNTNPKLVLEDLKRLLKVSQIG